MIKIILGNSVCYGINYDPSESKPKFLFEPFDIESFAGTTIELPCQGEGELVPEVYLILYYFIVSSWY